MARPSLSRYRQIVATPFGIFAFAVYFVVIDGFLRYLDRLIPGIFGRFAYLLTLLLFLASVFYGFRRVVGLHPIWNDGYRTWLESTPWTSRKPLPMGPVELVWEDGLTLGPLLLLSTTQPVPHAVHLLCAFLLSHLLAVAVTLWLTRIRPIGFTTAFGLGLAVWLWRQPLLCLAALIVLYLIAYVGLRQGLERFPWKPRKMIRLNNEWPEYGAQVEPCGWPYDRMLRDVHGDPLIAPMDLVLCCIVVSWWFFVISSLAADHSDRVAILSIFCILTMMLSPWIRLWLYVVAYRSPISFWGRIWTGRWIIPGYDQILIAPVCSIFSGPLVLYLLHVSAVSLEYSLPVASGVATVVAVIVPPRLRRWRLTGNHRLVPAVNLRYSQSAQELVQVG